LEKNIMKSIKMAVLAVFLILFFLSCSSLSKPLAGGGGAPTLTPDFTAELQVTHQGTFTPAPAQTSSYVFTATLANTSTPQGTTMPIMTPTPTFAIGSTTLRQKDNMVMMYVPEGEFLMGSDPAKDKSAQFEEQPQHKVYLDAYWIDQTEVTNGMYGLCVNAGKCVPPQDDSSYLVPKYYGNSKYADYPVVHVDWNQAKAYCAWAGADLPTEAQWEKASRGTDGRLYPWGNNSPSCDLANFFGCSGDTTAVTSHKSGKSPYGVYDMAGNVREWVYDWYGYDYYSSSPGRNPQGPASSDFRALRGGSWYEADYGVRSAGRYFLKPSGFSYDVGFRCASTP
jgi:eukaryotic-like serine/threonine-protein kinase